MAIGTSITINLPPTPFPILDSVATITALRLMPSTALTDGQNIAVDGATAVGDGGGGLFTWSELSTALDDGASIVRPDDVPPLSAGRWVLSGSSTVTQLKTNLAAAGGAGLLGFSNAQSYAPATVGASLKSRGVVVTDAPYNADKTGVADSYAAFTAAIAASNYIIVPPGTYKLNTEPTWVGSIYWDIDPEAIFTGVGTGTDKFPYMLTNPAQLAVGPFIQSRSYQKSVHPNGGVAAFNIEMEQPADYGAGQSVGLYVGNISSNPNASGNNWACNFLTYAQAGAAGTYHGIEVDVNCDSASATTKGIAISGGGTQDADTAVEVTRLSGSKWNIGFYALNVQDATVLRPVSGGRGVVIHGVGNDVAGVGDTAFSARQLANNADTLLLQRNTNTAPTGQFIRAVNADNSANVFVVDVSGNITGRSLNCSDRVTMNTATLSGYAALNFANDTAAAGAGVPLGGIYHNAGALRVRIA